MTESAVVSTDLPASTEAGAQLGARIAEAFSGERPDVVIVFAGPSYTHTELLSALEAACNPRLLLGCSSAGEFTTMAQGAGMACAVGLRSTEMRFSAGLGRGIRADRHHVARELAASFTGLHAHDYRYRSALVLTDALAGHADDLVEQLTVLSAGTYQFFGGGAGDNAHFDHTPVFFGTEAVTDAAVSLEILSNKPVGIGVRHGWQPASAPMRVTEADGMRLVSLNAIPASDVFQEHAEATGQRFDPENPIPYFLHNILGIDTGDGYKLRVPLAVHPDGSITCAAEVPSGATVSIMRTTSGSASDAAATAATAAIAQLDGHTPNVALFFDCVATRLRMGEEFDLELDAVQAALHAARYVGCNTHGQIARAEGQFSGFHNCTAVVCVIPE